MINFTRMFLAGNSKKHKIAKIQEVGQIERKSTKAIHSSKLIRPKQLDDKALDALLTIL